jgi:broad-specificity NMP kinase
MPLVVMTGYPSSGKSTWASKLAQLLRDEHGKEVEIVREEDEFRGEKNDILDGQSCNLAPMKVFYSDFVLNGMKLVFLCYRFKKRERTEG